MGSCRGVDDPVVQCRGKLSFKSQAATTRHFSQVLRKDPLRHLMEAYCCPHCGAWHFGHAPGSWRASQKGKPWIKRARQVEIAQESELTSYDFEEVE